MYSIHIKSYIETLCHFDKVFSVLQTLMLYARSLSQEDACVEHCDIVCMYENTFIELLE